MKITKLQQVRYSSRLDKLREDEPELANQVEVAHKFGDSSENSELDSAKAELSRNRLEQSEIINIMENSEIINYDNSPLIVEGSIVEVKYGMNTLTLLLSDVGNLVLDGILLTNSPLGSAILGNIDGEFNVNNHRFFVKKIVNPDIDSFIEKYPSSEEVLNRYFEGCDKKSN